MKAIRFEKFGSPEVLKYVDVEQPVINKQDCQTLLIKVIASGVNPIDAKIRSGSSFASAGLVMPSGLGFDICGEVVGKSADVRQVEIGEYILGRLEYKNLTGYSQYCKINVNQAIIKPKKVNSDQAACLPIAGLTAWQSLYTYGKLQKSERVLIHAASGGVGHLAVQLAKKTGAYVIATASKKNHQFVHALGADEMIDYKNTPFDQVAQGIDLVIDLVGGDTGIQSLKVLKSNGRLVTIPTNTRDEILAHAKQLGINASGMLATTNLAQLETLAQLVAEDKLTIYISKSLSLKEASQAHIALETGRTVGKIVLTCEH